MGSINIDQLAAEIANMLGEYQQELILGIDAGGKAVAKKAAKVLKETSPKRAGDKKRRYSGSGKSYSPGSYAKGWSVETTKEFAEAATYEVHNKGHYYLTHLLENGHATRSGGRTKKLVHIKPAEEMAIKEYADIVEEVIENAGK